MKLTKKQAKAIIKICSCSEINENRKIQILRLLLNNEIEMLLEKIKRKLEQD